MSTAKRPKNARPRKSATTTAKAAKKARAKVPVPPPPPSSSFGANAVMIPTTDALLGAQFNANVNCRPVKNRKGKTRQKCDRQRLAVVGGATPAAEHPKRKQLFAVQVGQRFTVPDREIRRDLRAGAGARARYAPALSCDDYARDILAGGRPPGIAYEMCPTLPDAVEPTGPVDTSFDFKANGRSASRGAGFAFVQVSGLNTSIISQHATREAAEAAMRRKGYEPTALSSFNGGHGIFDLAHYDVIDLFGKKTLRMRTSPKANGAHKANSMTVANTIAQQLGGTGRLNAMIGAYGFSGGDNSLSFRVNAKNKARVQGIRITLDPSDTYSVTFLGILMNPMRAAPLYVATDVHAEDLRRVVEEYTGLALGLGTMGRKPNHHGGQHAPGDPLGVYLPTVDGWARGGGRFVWTHRILGWMFRVYPNRSGRGFDASVAVDPEALRTFRFPTPAGGHARSPVFEVAEGAPSASSARDALADWYSYVARKDVRKANRAPTGAAPGQTYADRRADDLRGLRVSGDDYSGQVRERAVGLDGRAPSHIVGGHVLPRSRIAAAVKREALRALPAPRGATMNVMSADEGMRRMDEIMAAQEARETRAAVRAPLQLGPGTPEPLRPRPPRPAPAPVAPVGLSDAELAAEFERLLTGKANGRRRYR